MSTPVRALLIAPQWVGDAVMTEPLVRALAARGEWVNVAVLPHIAPVYQAMQGVAAVLPLPFDRHGLRWAERRAMGKRWRGQFDVAYIAPNSLKSALLPWFACIPKRVGYVGELRYPLLTKALPNPSRTQRPPMVQWYAALANADASSAHASSNGQPSSDRPRLHIPAEDAQRVAQQHQLTSQHYLVLAPGAEYGMAKRWPSSHYAQLAAWWAQHRATPVLLLGSGKEAALCQSIVDAARTAYQGDYRNVAGQCSLGDSMALIAAAAHVVSNDSGLMHVAAALDVPQVALFGSSNPEHTPPLSPHATVLWLKHDADYQPTLDCAPCYQRECPLGHTRCLNDLSPERVVQHLS